MIADKPFVGVLFMLGFCILAPMGDALAKVLGETIPLLQLLLARFAAQAVLLLPLTRRETLGMTPRVFWLTALRTLLHICGIGAMFTALRFMPLADTVAIAFVMPFILLIAGHFLAREEVGIRRFAACIAGFAGTLMVIQPSFAEVGAPALLPLIVAFAFAGYMMVTRLIAKETDPIGIQCVSGWMAVAVLAAIWALTDPSLSPALAVVRPGWGEAGLLLCIGAIGTLAHLLMTWSLRYAPSATLAPMQYLEIPIATIIGWIAFRDLPNGLAALGIAITVGAGLYIVFREQRIARQAAAPGV